MKYFILLFFLSVLSITETTAQDTKSYLLKSIVSGGNYNATLGQIISGYTKPFHIGIRTPKRVALSIQESESVNGLIYPNPCYGVANIDLNDVKSVHITDMYGRNIDNSVDISSKLITLPYRGSFFVRITNTSNVTYSTTIIY
jgi:hypothetical protein